MSATSIDPQVGKADVPFASEELASQLPANVNDLLGYGYSSEVLRASRGDWPVHVAS